MEKETLHFKIGLSGTGTKHPQFKINVDNQNFYQGVLTQAPEVTEYFEFDVEIEEGEHNLEVELLNKLSTDTVKDNDGNIVDDMLLNIDLIEIDNIDLGVLRWTGSIYEPIYPDNYTDESQKQIKQIKNCVNLGWNGVWRLPFTSPYYIWLLENI